jgi:SAM-dependent methyltransferase
LRNRQQWRPTKFHIGKSGQLRVPGTAGELAPGSTLIMTLVARWYAKTLPRYACGTLLDLGCGKMPFYELYADHVEQVLSMDWPRSLHDPAFPDFAADLNRGIPLRVDVVDTLLASDVLEHIYKPHILLAEMFRVLRPGGVALINMPFLYWVYEAPYDFYRYTRFAVECMGKNVGFQIEELHFIDSRSAVLIDVAGKLLQRLPLGGGVTARLLPNG